MPRAIARPDAQARGKAADAPAGCAGCRQSSLDFDFTMAFQPIVDIGDRSVYAHEALVRGTRGESAQAVLARVDDRNRYAFDQACRVKAIRLAAALRMRSRLSINFLPNAIYTPQSCIRTTLDAARELRFDIRKIIFELTENEESHDTARLTGIFAEYRRLGFGTALDDFGSGYSAFDLLAEFRPDIVKIAMPLIRGIDGDPVRRVIVRGICDICRGLDMRILGEGVETRAELSVLRDFGIGLFQGYLFARPAVAALPEIDWSALA